MRRLLGTHNAVPLALGVIAVVIAAAGGAYAANSGGTITVCVHHNGGGLYEARKCAKHDANLSWNAQGPPGQPGTPGLQGPRGPQGSPGTNGTNGTDGLDGTARAYGLVSRAGTLTQSKNATVASHTMGSGMYCIAPAAGIDPSTTVLVATPDFSDDQTDFGVQGPQAVVEWHSGSGGCDPGQMEALTGFRSQNGSTPVNSVDLKPADEGFSFVIP
jgi:hypothetical protein